MFQSTYLYKVRPFVSIASFLLSGFNPRTYIRYDFKDYGIANEFIGFNPRTYIRYDSAGQAMRTAFGVSIHVPI